MLVKWSQKATGPLGDKIRRQKDFGTSDEIHLQGPKVSAIIHRDSTVM